jgi:alpha-glucosidase
MQWSAAPNAGFSSAKPWLPLADDCASVNVECQRLDPGSMLGLYRELLALRHARPTLSLGRFESFDAGPNVLGYFREHGEQRDLVLLNLSSARARLQLQPALAAARVLVSTHPGRVGAPPGSELASDEAVVLAVSG